MAKKTYKVTGELPVAGHQPGEEFTEDFGDQEEALIQSGHIKPAGKSAEKKED